jgi:hypothetical protein
MGGRVIRGTAIASGVAAVAGLGIGYAVGEPVQPEDVQPARLLPANLCARLGDISPLLPKTTKAKFAQTGNTEVICSVKVNERTQLTFTAAELTIRITSYAGRRAGPGESSYTPAEMAKEAFDRKPWPVVNDRPYPTKVEKIVRTGGMDSRVSVLVNRADLVVQVEYAAHPVDLATAQQAAQVLADRAIWESK